MRSSFPVFTVGAVVLGVILVAGYFLTREDAEPPVVTPPMQSPVSQQAPAPEPVPQPEPETAQQPERPAPAEPLASEPEPEPAYDVVAPPETIDNSDTVVKKAVLALSPTLAEWLIPEEQVRKWVLAVDKLADGQLPKRYRPMQYPMDKFKVKAFGDLSVMEDVNYGRIKPLIETLKAIDPKLLAAYYQAWKPLLEQAYSQQGEPGTFDARLMLAIDRFLTIRPLEEKAPLVRPHVFYVYEDEELEKATDVEKLAWRMGEENMRELQAYALAFKQAITQE
jgi:hypothetical protein